MTNLLSQAKVYLKPGQQAPKGAVVHKGKGGGSWYESTGRGPASQDQPKGGSKAQQKNTKRMKGKQLPDAWNPKKQTGPGGLKPEHMEWLKSNGINKYPPPNNTQPGSVVVHKGANPATQALLTWRNNNGTLVHSYTPEFHKNNAQVKWKAVERFRPQVVKMRNVLNGIVKKEKPGSPGHQEAMVASVIAHTGLRPGNPISASKGNYGVSTLQTNHLKFDGKSVKLEFIGKSGMLNKKTITDPTLVGGLKSLHDQAKKDGRKNLFTVDVSNVRTILPKGMKLKTFRTIIATEEAERFLAGKNLTLSGNKAKDKKAVAATLKEASTYVASQLNNTPAVARSSYIHPNVFNDWLKKIGGVHLGA